MYPEKYVQDLYRSFQKKSSLQDAFFMAKYMKNRFPFFGLKKMVRLQLEKEVFRQNGIPALQELPEIVTLLWELPERECQYVAMDLMNKFRKNLNPDHLELLEYCIVNKPWWDTVDLIAARLVGTLFLRYQELILPANQRWLEEKNLWLWRTCLLFQLKYKQATNRELLERNILYLTGEKDYFIQKAIGWILREYSKTNPEWVLQFVQKKQLSPLSKREALKVVNRKK